MALAARIKKWNSQLEVFARTFSEHHLDVSVAIYDAFALISYLLDEPAKHGFKDSFSTCPINCIWNDEKHAGFRAHRYLAEELVSLLDSDDSGWTLGTGRDKFD